MLLAKIGVAPIGLDQTGEPDTNAALFGAGTPDRLLTLVNAAAAALVRAPDEAVPKACARTVDCGEAANATEGTKAVPTAIAAADRARR